MANSSEKKKSRIWGKKEKMKGKKKKKNRTKNEKWKESK